MGRFSLNLSRETFLWRNLRNLKKGKHDHVFDAGQSDIYRNQKTHREIGSQKLIADNWTNVEVFLVQNTLVIDKCGFQVPFIIASKADSTVHYFMCREHFWSTSENWKLVRKATQNTTGGGCPMSDSQNLMANMDQPCEVGLASFTSTSVWETRW